jgi:hypothetical protein
VIGRFPWDPFPAGEPDPKGPDPVHSALYRAAVGGADAYRAVRQALRVERGMMRVGNRFVPEGRYRQVGFLAVGHAAASMALAALDALGDRLTQGFVAGPDPPPAYLPFRSVVVPDGWGPHPAAPQVLEAAREIAVGLRENDLFVVLVSPGATRSLLEAPPTIGAPEFGRLLRTAHEKGATGPELGTVVRALGAGGVGGRLLPGPVVCDLQSLVVDRGDGPTRAGGGPTIPLAPAEAAEARTILARTGLDREAGVSVDPPALPTVPTGFGRRPVQVAGPSEGLRAAADLAFDKGWTIRVGDLLWTSGPEEAAEHLNDRVEGLLPDARRSGGSSSKGLVVLSMLTLNVPDGTPEDPACRRFLERAESMLRRREMSVGLCRTSGPLGTDPAQPDPAVFAGAVVGAPTDPESSALRQQVRALRMRPGITDVGVLAAAVLPTEG